MGKAKGMLQRLGEWVEQNFWPIFFATLAATFAAGAMLADASALGPRLAKAEQELQQAKEEIAGIKGTIGGIKDRVDDIAAFLRVPRRYGKTD